MRRAPGRVETDPVVRSKSRIYGVLRQDPWVPLHGDILLLRRTSTRRSISRGSHTSNFLSSVVPTLPCNIQAVGYGRGKRSIAYTARQVGIYHGAALDILLTGRELQY